MIKFLASGTALILASAALGQTNPSPNSMHSCTELTDPRQLQECLERSTGLDNRFVPQGTTPSSGPDELLRDHGTTADDMRVPANGNQ